MIHQHAGQIKLNIETNAKKQKLKNKNAPKNKLKIIGLIVKVTINKIKTNPIMYKSVIL